jgi:ribosomal-protein-alanine N-acetyltransferase
VTDLFPRTFETERLRFERIHPETLDALDVYPFASTEDGIEDATQYMTWDPHAHPKETLEFVRGVGDANDASDGGTYALYPTDGERGAGEFAGNAGMHPDWGTRTVTLGIWLRKPFWGRGYSGERADAFVELAFDRLDAELVAVVAAHDNDRSRRAIEKYVDRWGGSHEGRFRRLHTQDGGPRDSHRYAITRADYETAAVDVDLAVVDE